jgi:hypothetical protein
MMKETYQIAIELYEGAVHAGAPSDICHLCSARVNEGVKGCFELFSELCALGYTNSQYGAVTFYGVDAHALQHPEIHGKKNNAAHLLRLHWIFARGAYTQSGVVPTWWQQYLQRRDVPRLAPPTRRGTITVTEVAGAQSPQAYADLMQQWAHNVYDAWHMHHEWARRALARLLHER